jgi:hypothetical protein
MYGTHGDRLSLFPLSGKADKSLFWATEHSPHFWSVAELLNAGKAGVVRWPGKDIQRLCPHRSLYGREPPQTGRRRKSYPKSPSPGITTCAM